MNFCKFQNFSNLNMQRFLAQLSIMVLLAGCGAVHPFSSTKNISPSPRPLLVAMSGFSTCNESEVEAGPAGSKIYKRALNAAVKMEQVFGVQPSIITTCFTRNSELMVSSSASQWVVNSPTEEEFIADARAQMTEATHVFVIGHSHGGWLAMKLVASHSSVDSNRDSSLDTGTINALFTIDPISKTLCTFSHPRGCFSAPEDFDNAARNRIKETTGVWVNPWQDTTVYLHSSSIIQADRNPKFNLAHNSIPESEVVWSDFTEQFHL